jgi:hypothetical protein
MPDPMHILIPDLDEDHTLSVSRSRATVSGLELVKYD